MSDEKQVQQQNKNLEQQSLQNILPALYLSLAILKVSILSRLKKKNITSLLLPNQNSLITSKTTTRLKWTNCDQSHSLAPKRAKVTEEQKLAESTIYKVVEQLKIFCKKKKEQ